MTLRTPRRRISPRTKRRYRAIKDFLRRAIGSPSEPDIKINSSIAINVTELKHKINGLEHRLNQVNKHCQDLVYLETSSKNDCPVLLETEDGTEAASLKAESNDLSLKKSSVVETKLLYKTPESEYRKSDDSGGLGNLDNDPTSRYTVKSDRMLTKQHASIANERHKRKNKMDQLKTVNESQPNLRKHKTQSAYEKIGSHFSTSSCHSLNDLRTAHAGNTLYHKTHKEKKQNYRDYTDPIHKKINGKRNKDHSRRNSPENVIHEAKHKNKSKFSQKVDEDFIADLIKRQYRPIKIGKRESGMSQISAPVCRDQEFKIRDDILEGSDLCSCCIEGRKNNKIYPYDNGINEQRSICDTKLYSSKSQMSRNHHHHHRKKAVYNRYDSYNDSEQYDLIPVKEKSSPKSRRRIFVDTSIPYNYYKEVPPSPRTLRPKLNLKAQYFTEFEDYMMQRNICKRRSYSPNRQRIISHNIHRNEHSDVLEYYKGKRKSQFNESSKNVMPVQHDTGNTSTPPSPVYQKEQHNQNYNSLNKTQDSDLSGDKTDKALSEIKDILQSFLQEIKKETTSVSQCGNSDVLTSKPGDKCLNEFRPSNTKLNSSAIPESGLCFNNFAIPQCNTMAPSFVPPYTNTCCYPILPIYPMNYMQSGFIMPSPSCTCNCVNNSKDDQQRQNETNIDKTSTNTEDLIKEIYKVVAQNQNNDVRKDSEKEKVEDSHKRKIDNKLLTSRSAGESSRISKHDVEVSTQKVKCHSKSCEAIGSRKTSETYYTRTNPTYSDTVLDRLSLEATASTTESESSCEQTRTKKSHKKNKLAKVLRSFGLLKKKKDVIEELSESESTVEVSLKAKPPFRQEIMNYSMHCQEYCNRPPIPTRNDPYNKCYGSPRAFSHSCPKHGNPIHSSVYDCYNNHKIPCAHHTESPCHSPHPSAPPYPNPYDHFHQAQPQVPLCLKEIEVKSTGTQSERKMPFFRRFRKRMQESASVQRIDECGARNYSTQTDDKLKPTKPLPASKLAKLNWKTLQAKVNELDKPDKFTYKTQKKLAEGDVKMRNAMLKKLFYKKNPFSPRNLIVKTILGKDKSSYGEPPMLYRPRLFL